ncbi:hypothetical protein ILYODFUR_016542 [Ilyodon furcidens]|uniref:Uncharacterized protein n=2 Tax=Goodeidae TaxID=28758 RepID=A0ABV0SLS9_9TELE
MPNHCFGPYVTIQEGLVRCLQTSFSNWKSFAYSDTFQLNIRQCKDILNPVAPQITSSQQLNLNPVFILQAYFNITSFQRTHEKPEEPDTVFMLVNIASTVSYSMYNVDSGSA